MTTKSLRPHASTDKQEVISGLLKHQKQLKYLKTGIDKAYGWVWLLEPTPDLDLCLVEKLNKDIDSLMKRLSDIVEDVLSLPADDTTSFNEAASLQDVLGNMTLKLIKLSHNQEHRIMEEAGASSRVQLSKINGIASGPHWRAV